MKRSISLPGLLAGALAALIVYLLVSHSAIGWMLLGMAIGAAAAGAALARRGQGNSAASPYVDGDKVRAQ